MIRAKEKHERHIEICAQNSCAQCKAHEVYVPNGCPFKILHLLSTDKTLNNGEVRYRPRRSGKTTEIIRQAKLRADLGEQVVIVVGHSQEKRRIQRLVGDNKSISILAAYESRAIMGYQPTSVFGDELDETQLKSVCQNTQPGAFRGCMTTHPHNSFI